MGNEMTPWYQYGQGPQFAGGAPRGVLDRVSADEAANLSGLDIKQSLDGCLRFRKYWKAGVAVGLGDVLFFTKKLNDRDAVVNDANLEYTMEYIHTNLEQGGTLERGQFMLCESMEIMPIFNTNIPNTKQSTGNTTLVANTGTYADATSVKGGIMGGVLFNEIAHNASVQLYVGSKNPVEEGLVREWPTEFGASGFLTSVGSVAASTAVQDGAINNGCFKRRLFRNGPRQIVPGKNFNVTLKFHNNFVPAADFAIDILLRGPFWRDIN